MNTIDIAFDGRLEKILRFVVEIDKVKSIMRKSKLFDMSRFENDAEHSRTICVMALLLEEYADFPVDLARVIPMLLIHDIVEIDAGDTFLYSAERGNAHDNEVKAAERIFGMLDDERKTYFVNVWNEFEDRKTNEAKFAAVFDRLEPLLQNYLNEGYTWKKHGISCEMIIEKNRHIAEASGRIWNFVLSLLDAAVGKGYLEKQ